MFDDFGDEYTDALLISRNCFSHGAGFEICIYCAAGGEDRRLAWYDLDLSAKPYKALRYHKAAVRGAAFHRTYPLFASTSDDGAIHVFHGAVYQVRLE